MKAKIYLIALCSLIFSACDDGCFIGIIGDCDDDIDENGIELTLLNQESKPPANVTIFYKADFSNGDAVPDLSTTDIKIFEDGELISDFEAERAFIEDSAEFKFSSVLLLDLSGSILDAAALPTLKTAAEELIGEVFRDDNNRSIEMAIYWFDGEQSIHLLENFSSDTTILIQSVRQITSDISSDNSTNLNGAVVQAVSVIEQRLALQSSNVSLSAGSILIFTDGKDRAGRVDEFTALATVENASDNISSLTVGLGGEIDRDVLQQYGKDGFEFADNLQNLTNSFRKIAGKIRDEANSFYILEYCSPKRAGIFSLKIEALKNRKRGSLETSFSADGFTGGCQVNQ